MRSLGAAFTADETSRIVVNGKNNRFEYTGGKLTYASAAKDTYEVWAKGAQLSGMTRLQEPLRDGFLKRA